MRRAMLMAFVAAVMSLGACRGNGVAGPDQVLGQVPKPTYLSTVLVEYTSVQDMSCEPDVGDPYTWNGCVFFHVYLYDPIHPERGSCATGQAPFRSSCPEVVSEVRQVGPFTYRAELRNVYTNFADGNPKHSITASEVLEGYPRLKDGIITGRNFTVEGAVDLEFAGGTCATCITGEASWLKFRIPAQ